MNWVQDGLSYNNSELWNNNDNKLVIEEFKKITMRPESALQYGIFNPQLFSYAKSLTLFKIY